MPPKRKAPASTVKESTSPVKISKLEAKKLKHDALVVLLDCGSGMSSTYEEDKSKTYFEVARETADWIVSRKIFAQSSDLISVVTFGSDETSNSLNMDGVYVHNEVPCKASFDQLKFLSKEVSLNEKKLGDLGFGLTIALNVLREHAASFLGEFVEQQTIVVISKGDAKNTFPDDLHKFSDTINSMGVHLISMGVDENSENENAKWLTSLVEKCEGSSFSFSNVINGLSHFLPKQTESRFNNKQWEIAPGVRLPLAFSTKSVKFAGGLKSVLVDESGSKMERVVEMSVMNDAGESESTFTQREHGVMVEKNSQYEAPVLGRQGPHFFGYQNETEDDPWEEKAKPNILTKDKMCTGYYFGQSLIFFDDEELETVYNNHNFNEGEKGGCLKLIQFTKRANISPSYFIGKQSYTVLPAVTKATSAKTLNETRCTLAVMQAMLEQNVVAICRYAYHASAHLQLMALIPHKDEESGVVYLRALRLPFMDDMRCLKFPKLDMDLTKEKEDKKTRKDSKFSKKHRDDDASGFDTKPSLAQLTAIDDLIDIMQFSDETAQNFSSGTVMDPQLQMQCMYIKNKVLNPDDTDSGQLYAASTVLKKSLAPNQDIIDTRTDLFERLSRDFNLQKIEKVKRNRIELTPIDIQKTIDEAKTLLDNSKKSEESSSAMPAKKRQTANNEPTLETSFEKNAQEAALKACRQQLQSIAGLCQIPANTMYQQAIFALPEQALKQLRELCVKYNEWRPFNDLLRSMRRSRQHASFVEFMGDQKSFSLINSEDIVGCIVSSDEAAEFWDEVDMEEEFDDEEASMSSLAD